MMFRLKSDQASSLRYFVYLSDLKLQMFVDQISQPVRRSIAAELKVDLKLVSLTLSSEAVDRSLYEPSRLAKLAVVERYIERHQKVGNLADSRGYITADVEMDWKPCDDNETVLFCGYHDELLVVLGGSLSNLLGRPPSPGQIGSHPYTIQAAVRRGGEVDDLGTDLQAAAQAVYVTPQPVRFLSRVISRGSISKSKGITEYLLATPLYVEAIDTAAIGSASE